MISVVDQRRSAVTRETHIGQYGGRSNQFASCSQAHHWHAETDGLAACLSRITSRCTAFMFIHAGGIDTYCERVHLFIE
jgi:hypothetical protein